MDFPQQLQCFCNLSQLCWGHCERWGRRWKTKKSSLTSREQVFLTGHQPRISAYTLTPVKNRFFLVVWRRLRCWRGPWIKGQTKRDKRSRIRSFFSRGFSLIFADFRFSWKWEHFRGADSRRKPQETAEFCRNPFVPFSLSLLIHPYWMRRVGRMSETQPPLLLKKVSQYTSNLYGNTPPICSAVLLVPLRSEERECWQYSPFVPQYASHLYCNTPPICTTVCFWKSWRLWSPGCSPEKRHPHSFRYSAKKHRRSTLSLQCKLLAASWALTPIAHILDAESLAKLATNLQTDICSGGKLFRDAGEFELSFHRGDRFPGISAENHSFQVRISPWTWSHCHHSLQTSQQKRHMNINRFGRWPLQSGGSLPEGWPGVKDLCSIR